MLDGFDEIINICKLTNKFSKKDQAPLDFLKQTSIKLIRCHANEEKQTQMLKPGRMTGG